MRTLLFILSLGYSCSIWGQLEKRDSLLFLAQQLDSIAEYNFEIGNDSIAIEYGTKCLKIRESVLGVKNPQYAKSLCHLATYYYEQGNYSEAIVFVQSAIDIQKNLDGKEWADYAESLTTLADIQLMTGDYKEAIELGKEVLNINGDIYGRESIEYATSLGSLADYYYEFGYVTESVNLCENALNIFKAKGNTHSSEYATILSTMAKCKTDLGYEIEALQLGKKALGIFMELYGNHHPSYAAILSCLSVNYSMLGNSEESIRLEKEAMSIFQKNYGTMHPHYATSLMNLALSYSDIGDIDNSFKYAFEALEIYKDILGNDNLDYVRSLNSISVLLWKGGKIEEALRLLKESITIIEEIDATNTIEYGKTLLSLAECYCDLTNYSEALKYGLKALELTTETYGRNDIEKVKVYDLISFCYLKLDCYDESVFYAKKYTSILTEYIIRNFSGMSSSQRYKLWDLFGYRFLNYAGHAFRIPESSIISDIYNKVAMFAKGILLATDIEMKKLLMESGDSSLITKYDVLLSNKELYRKVQEFPIDDCYVDADSLCQEILRQEDEFIQKSKEYGDFAHNLKLTWEDVRQNLKENDIAIEFLSIPIANDSIIYVALTIRKDSNSPHMTVLFEERQLKEVSDTLYYQCDGVADLVWKPLIPELKGIKNIYFSPAGALYNIGIEYLPEMEDYNIYRLSSTRELAISKQRQGKGKNAVLYGGLDYNAPFDSLSTKRSTTVLNDIFRERSDVRGLGLRGGKEPLKHTKIEVDKIGEELNKAKWVCLLDTASLGTEESFKSLSGRKINCLHMSTHGFYYTKEEADNAQYRFMLLGDQISATAEDKVLTRSGLILSGANHILEGDTLPDNVEDGILTAKEIADVDLRGLDLVVLSACQTGLGDIAQGEGVFGLQRGFKKAGANSILMSLWEVNDEATQILMTQFYKNLLSDQSKRQSLQSAQKYLREYNNGRFNEPRYWAAFILLDGIEKN
jgi:Uncharacterized protein conserved in bacteria